MKFLFSILFLFSSAFVFADEVGNGGDAVVCFCNSGMRDLVAKKLKDSQALPNPAPVFNAPEIQKAITSIDPLDFYLLKQPTGIPPKPVEIFEPKGNITEKVFQILERLAVNISVGKDARAVFANTIPLSNWIASEGVPEIRDEGIIGMLPSNCLLTQLARRVNNIIYYDKYLFSKLNDQQLTAIVVHEILMATPNRKAGINVHGLTRLLLRKDFDDTPILDRVSFVKTHFDKVIVSLEFFGYPVEIDWSYTVPNYTGKSRGYLAAPNGAPKIIIFNNWEARTADSSYFWGGNFSPNGQVKSLANYMGSFNGKHVFEFSISGAKIWAKELFFSDNDTICDYPDSSGDWKGHHFNVGDYVLFKKGELIDVGPHLKNDLRCQAN